MLRALVAQLDAAHEEVKQDDGGDVDDVAAALEELVEQLPAWARESVDGVVGSGGGSGAAERLRAEVRSLAAPALPPRPLDTARRAADLRSAAEAELAAMEAAERRAEPLPPPPPPTDPVEDEAPPPPPLMLSSLSPAQGHPRQTQTRSGHEEEEEEEEEEGRQSPDLNLDPLTPPSEEAAASAAVEATAGATALGGGVDEEESDTERIRRLSGEFYFSFYRMTEYPSLM